MSIQDIGVSHATIIRSSTHSRLSYTVFRSPLADPVLAQERRSCD